MVELIKLMRYMVHNVDDLQLLLGTMSDKLSASLYKILGQNDGIPMSNYVNKSRILDIYSKTMNLYDRLKYINDILRTVKYKLRNMNVDDPDLHLVKIRIMLKYPIVDMKKLDYASQLVFLLPTIVPYIKRRPTSDYSKGEKKQIDDIEWKEQDPMTQVTTTFNPLIYDNFIHLISTSKLLE